MRASLREGNPRTQRKRTAPSGGRQGGRDPSDLAGRPSRGTVESERARWDPKDGELGVSRTKPGETLVEVRSGTDVQIVRLTCA